MAHAEAAPLAVDTAQIDKFVETMREKLDIPGVAVGIVQGDQTVYTKGYGISGPDGQPVTAQTPFILGSVSKSFTALGIMQLVEQGKIDLDAPVQHYLPDFELADKEASKTILVRHLLNQNSGLSTLHGRSAFTNTMPTIDALIHNLKDTPLTEAVGNKFQYSNFNYDILGELFRPFPASLMLNIFRIMCMLLWICRTVLLLHPKRNYRDWPQATNPSLVSWFLLSSRTTNLCLRPPI